MLTDFKIEMTKINKVSLARMPKHSVVIENEKLEFLARQSTETPFI